MNCQSRADAWREVDLLFVDSDPATQYAAGIDALKRLDVDRFLPRVVVLPVGSDGAPWLDAGFADVVYLPAQRSEVLARLRVLLRLRASSIEADRLSVARNHMTVESSIDAVLAVDHGGYIVDFNPAAESMFVYPREAVLGKPFPILAQVDCRLRWKASAVTSAKGRNKSSGDAQGCVRRDRTANRFPPNSA